MESRGNYVSTKFPTFHLTAFFIEVTDHNGCFVCADTSLFYTQWYQRTSRLLTVSRCLNAVRLTEQTPGLASLEKTANRWLVLNGARVCVCVLPSVCFAWVKNWIVGENKLSQVTWPSYWHSPNLMGSIINVGHFPTYWARRASGTVRWRDWGFDISQIASDWSSPLPHRKKEMKRDKWISSPLQKCSPPSLLPQPCDSEALRSICPYRMFS